MNKAKYDSMSAAQKKVIDDHCTNEWAEKVAGAWADFESAGRAKTEGAAGHEVYKLTPEQLDAWQQGRRAAAKRGPRREEGRGGSGGDHGVQGHAGEVQRGALSDAVRRPDSRCTSA